MAIRHMLSGPVTIMTPRKDGRVWIRYQSGRIAEVDGTELSADDGIREIGAALATIANTWDWREWDTSNWHLQATTPIKEQSANTEERKVKIVAQFGPEYSFVSDSQDTAPIKESVPDAKNYDAFFVLSGDGEYTAVWGMVGIVPYRSKLVTRLL